MLYAQVPINHGRYCSYTWLSFITRKILSKQGVSTSAKIQIQPWIENKIEDIADFVVKKHVYLPMFETSKTVRKKTPEERIHRKANGEIEFEEWDMHAYVGYLGHALGRELFAAEKYIRSNYSLEEVK